MTSMVAEGEVILRTDVLGRVTMPRERRERVLDEFDESGLSGAEFARLSGVKYQTFANWVQRRRRERKQYPKAKKAATHPPLQWVEAILDKTSPVQANRVLIMHLANGVRLEIADAAQAALAAALLRSLENKSSLAC